MTPRAFWDRDGYLYEEHVESNRLRLVWSPETGFAVNPKRKARSSEFGDRQIVEHLYGPLIPAA